MQNERGVIGLTTLTTMHLLHVGERIRRSRFGWHSRVR